MEAFPFYSVDSTAWQMGGKAGAYRIFDGRRMTYIPQDEWKANLHYCIPALHRRRPPGEQMDQSCDTGIYFFVVQAMKAEVHFERYINELWKRRGVDWPDGTQCLVSRATNSSCLLPA